MTNEEEIVDFNEVMKQLMMEDGSINLNVSFESINSQRSTGNKGTMSFVAQTVEDVKKFQKQLKDKINMNHFNKNREVMKMIGEIKAQW